MFQSASEKSDLPQPVHARFSIDFEGAFHDLEGQPEFIRLPLARQLKRLQRACARHSPDTAHHARVLKSSVAFVEETTGRALGEVGARITALAGAVLDLRQVVCRRLEPLSFAGERAA